MSDRFDTDVRRRLDAAVSARIETIEHFAEIDSTSTYLLSGERPAVGQWRIAVADRQTAGRGRGDKRWHSPAGAGLWLSGAYTLAALPENLSALTLSVGVGVVDALSSFGVERLKLKWPNDVLADGRKLGGILLDSVSMGGAHLTIVCGVGINVDLGSVRERLNDELKKNADFDATDLASIVSDVPPASELAAAVIGALASTVASYEADGFAAFKDRWSELDYLRGIVVRISGEEERQGIAEGVADNGALRVREGSTVHNVVAGSVRPLRCARG